jgi:hypothetical protein
MFKSVHISTTTENEDVAHEEIAKIVIEKM